LEGSNFMQITSQYLTSALNKPFSLRDQKYKIMKINLYSGLANYPNTPPAWFTAKKCMQIAQLSMNSNTCSKKLRKKEFISKLRNKQACNLRTETLVQSSIQAKVLLLNKLFLRIEPWNWSSPSLTYITYATLFGFILTWCNAHSFWSASWAQHDFNMLAILKRNTSYTHYTKKIFYSKFKQDLTCILIKLCF